MDNILPVGTLLGGRYLLGEVCGRSRIGAVYAATDTKPEPDSSPASSENVIVKILSGRFIPGERSITFLASELEKRRAFIHPNLIRVLNVLRIPVEGQKESLAVVLQKTAARPYVELIAKRENGASNLFDILRVLSGVLNGMIYQHECGVEAVPLHPRRVFVDLSETAREVKIPSFAYFTSAEWTRDGSRWGCTTGIDYRYVAPEMLSEGSFLGGGAKSDIYLFGLFAFEAIAGTPPYEANRETLIQLHRTEPIPEQLLPANLPPWITKLLRSCLAKDPANRPSLKEVLDAISFELGVNSGPLSNVILPREHALKRVLFVGDNRLDQLSVARMAKSDHFPFLYRIAQSIEKAEEILEHREVDIVVTDHFLPDGTSFDLLKSESGIPVIVITGSDKSDVRDALLRAGAFACVTKDIRQAHLKSLPELLAKALRASISGGSKGS